MKMYFLIASLSFGPLLVTKLKTDKVACLSAVCMVNCTLFALCLGDSNNIVIIPINLLLVNNFHIWGHRLCLQFVLVTDGGPCTTHSRVIKNHSTLIHISSAAKRHRALSPHRLYVLSWKLIVFSALVYPRFKYNALVILPFKNVSVLFPVN